jgi:hypothetical protein
MGSREGDLYRFWYEGQQKPLPITREKLHQNHAYKAIKWFDGYRDDFRDSLVTVLEEMSKYPN